MCHKQASCYSLNERVLMNILCSYEFIGIEEIEVKIASRHPSEKTRGGTPSRYGQIRPRHKSRCPIRSEEHTSELQSLMRISYAVFCLKKKKRYKMNMISSIKNIRSNT